MKAKLTFLTKLTPGGLVAVAIALWMQWLSGDPAFPKFPPGPVIFIGVAAIVIYGARWWWTPMLGSLIALLVTAGWFARLPQAMLRLNHPNEVARRFCIASGAFYLTLAPLGLAIGNPAMNRAWYFGPMLLHTGDHIFHLVLGSIFLATGLLSGRRWIRHPSQA
jgi:hypothetical protein